MTTPEPMYESIEDFEESVGYKVGDAFKMGWEMARLKMPPSRKQPVEKESKPSA